MAALAGPSKIVTEIFASKFGRAPREVWRAPGRVNLIGEHTDYNLGFVMPVALALDCQVAAGEGDEQARDEEAIDVYSENLHEMRRIHLKKLDEVTPAGEWTDYVTGVARELRAAGIPLQPASLAIYSSVPVGSGLSSSAAIEVAAALALLGGRPFDPLELALLCQRAERNFVGVPCGIMDQYVSIFGEDGKALKIDCRTLTHTAVNLPDTAIIAVNSMVKHDLGASAYSMRVSECAEAVAVMKQRRPEVKSLRDVSLPELEEVRDAMDEVIYRRALHVVSENDRVGQFAAAAEAGDLRRMGELLLDSHRSLQLDYEVSCAELDFLVDAAMQIPGVYGARMTGGGFGGCTVNLVDPALAPEFEQTIAEVYEGKYHKPQIVRCLPGAGASQL